MSRRGRGRPARYDWDSLFSCRQFTLAAGVDYDCGQEAMMQQVRNEASRRGLSVVVADTGGGVTAVVRNVRRDAEEV